jgi:hypothetical protein
VPGCLAHVSLDFSEFVFGSAGAAAYPLVVPSLPALAGVIVHNQAVVFDAAAGNGAGFVLSDAATLIVGP